MQPARHGACIQLASPLNRLPARNFAVQLAAIAPIHALPQTTVIGVAVVVVVGGVGITGILLVRAIHSSFLPFDTLILPENCYEIKYKIVTILLILRAG